jgi:hypothetical protein
MSGADERTGSLFSYADLEAFHHSTAQGLTAIELEPTGKAAREVGALWSWTKDGTRTVCGEGNMRRVVR